MHLDAVPAHAHVAPGRVNWVGMAPWNASVSTTRASAAAEPIPCEGPLPKRRPVCDWSRGPRGECSRGGRASKTSPALRCSRGDARPPARVAATTVLAICRGRRTRGMDKTRSPHGHKTLPPPHAQPTLLSVGAPPRDRDRPARIALEACLQPVPVGLHRPIFTPIREDLLMTA